MLYTDEASLFEGGGICGANDGRSKLPQSAAQTAPSEREPLGCCNQNISYEKR